MREGQPTAIHREAYAAPAFWIDTVDLTFDLDPAKTRVLSKIRLRRNPDVAAQALRLDGEDLNLSRVLVNGGGTSFKMDGNQLVLENLPEGHEPFELEIFTTCNPEKNTQLMGLYVSNDSFFTQCEAEGFRRITYFLDRPDVMASYTTTLRADKAKYPVLLSNGNLVEQGALDDGRHFAKWVDPHKKPCYLFALVAGQLVAREQRILSRSGKEHLLQVFVRPGDLETMGVQTDFLGINYYSRAVIRSEAVPEHENAPPTVVADGPRTDMGWEVAPAALTRLLRDLHTTYGPQALYITENGCAYPTAPDADGRVRDVERVSYFASHLDACHDAVSAGVPLKGYFAWSLMDNFEWAWGYEKRFGLVWVDYETQTRILKDSAHLYRQVISARGLDA
jgi:hypothetical protein